jgi:hypothetical protein
MPVITSPPIRYARPSISSSEPSAAEARAFGRAPRLDDLDEEAVDERRLEQVLELARDDLPVKAQPRADDTAMREKRDHRGLGQIGGNGEADVLRVGDDGGIDADHLAAPVQERATRIARVDGRVRLDERLQHRVRRFGQHPIHPRHDAARQRLIEADRVADRDHVVAHAHAVGIAEGDRGQALRCRRADTQQGEVEDRIGADEPCRQPPAVVEVTVMDWRPWATRLVRSARPRRRARRSRRR